MAGWRCAGCAAARGCEYVAADIAQAMLDRTLRRRPPIGASTTRWCRSLADVAELPFDAGSFDLVVSFTGLHCFPDPARAVVEMARVLRPGGVITGSALLNDTGLRYQPMRLAGRVAGLLGPGLHGRRRHPLAHGQRRRRRDARGQRCDGLLPRRQESVTTPRLRSSSVRFQA